MAKIIEAIGTALSVIATVVAAGAMVIGGVAIILIVSPWFWLAVIAIFLITKLS